METSKNLGSIASYVDVILDTNPSRMVLSGKLNKNFESGYSGFDKIKINYISSKGGGIYQAEKFADKKVFHENIEKENIREALVAMLENFKQVSSISKEYVCDLRISKKGKILFSKNTQKNEFNEKKEHNVKKNYILKEGEIIEPLVDLGIFTKEGKIVNSKYDKYKQINRFVEIIDDEIKKIEEEYRNKNKVLRILDFGCGKSYLTFIIYYYFTKIKNMRVEIIGLDLKRDVIENCNKIAKKYGYENLKFELGDINGYRFDKSLDVVISLHACDTATDYALYNAIRWKARMIFSVPCCQHEINSSIKTDKLGILTRYGLIQEKVSSLFTDAIRANILRAVGYKTQVLEFIDFEHSPKNVLIRAVKSNVSDKKRMDSIQEIEELKKAFEFEQKLYELCTKDNLIKRPDLEDEYVR